jgi:hypothetical protein
MKRFLKHDRYQLSDHERESIWHGIRRDLKSENKTSIFRTVRLRPAVTALFTVAALAVLGAWWIDSNQAGKMGNRHPGFLGRAANQWAPQVATPPVKESGEEGVPPATLEETVKPESFDVEGAEYMVEVKSAVIEGRAESVAPKKDNTRTLNDALSKQSGVTSRPGELRVRGGRSGDVTMKIDGVAASPDPGKSPTRTLMGDSPPPTGSVTGGIKPPNGEQVELMYFEHTGVNPFIATEDDSLSTFAVDVDNASWTMARNYLSRGMLPPKDAIRVEEFVNAFDPGWERQTDDVFRIHSDGATSRFGNGYHLLRVGLVGKSLDDEGRKAANLIFVIDISGSMNRENRLGAV